MRYDIDAREPVGASRARRAMSEAAADETWLRWVGRFRFVDIRALAQRFQVSERAAWRRARRLVDARLLVSRVAGRMTVFYLGDRALRLLELPRRKPPRAPLAALTHELAIARWHAALEIAVEEQGIGRGPRKIGVAAIVATLVSVLALAVSGYTSKPLAGLVEPDRGTGAAVFTVWLNAFAVAFLAIVFVSVLRELRDRRESLITVTYRLDSTRMSSRRWQYSVRRLPVHGGWPAALAVESGLVDIEMTRVEQLGPSV